MKPETIMIDNVRYVKEDSINKAEVIEWTGEQTIMSRFIGKKVIVRSHNEGINAGVVVIADSTGIELSNCRRIWYHKPKDTSVSWYEGVATTGLSNDSKVSCTVSTKLIVEDYSITVCTDEAYNSIMEIKPNAQR